VYTFLMLTFDEYLSNVKALPFGKKVGKNVYVLWPDLKDESPLLSRIIESIGPAKDTTLIKFFLDQFKISFLDYPDFFENPHPELHYSETVNLATGKRRTIDYTKQDNPPILHRKETMISPERSEYSKWLELTKQLEKEGCYEEPRKIGFKSYWENLLNSKGLSYSGHELCKSTKNNHTKLQKNKVIDRHKTAMSRSDFSRPVQLLLKHKLISHETTFFDYGCGLGDDIRALEYNGYTASGWDPAYMNEEKIAEADIVNLGFVLNVIEDSYERLHVLNEAYNLAKKVLSVAVVTDTSPTAKELRPYKDGFLTSRGTFQKYYNHEEAQELIEETLNTSAYTVAPGIYFIFRDEKDAQDFLSAKQRRKVDWNRLNLHVYPSKDERNTAKKEILYAQHKDEIEAYWEKLIELGRTPTNEEHPETDTLKSTLKMSDKKLQEWFVERYGQTALKDAFDRRRDDLLVYLGLANFKKKVPYSSLSTRLKKDMKTFFGSYKAAKQEALVELFKIGDPDEIERRCSEIHQSKSTGRLDHQALYIETEELSELDPVLRMYIGVAELLYGDIEEVNIIKIHKRSGKTTFLIYDDYDKFGEYKLHYRIKVDLPNQKVYFFDHKI